MDPSEDPKLNADERRGLRNAVAAGPDAILADIRQAYAEGFAAHNGWLVSRAGRYGTNYKLRGERRPRSASGRDPGRVESIPWRRSTTPARTSPGRSDTSCTSIPDSCPRLAPSGRSASTTSSGFFVPNPIDRYLINDRTDLHFSPDGSLDVYIQHEEPSSPVERQNWLPAPTGDFRLLMRIYAAKPAAIPGILDGSGWDPPAIARALGAETHGALESRSANIARRLTEDRRRGPRPGGPEDRRRVRFAA